MEANSLECELCGTPEQSRPLIVTRFNGRAAHFCPGCMPALIHGMAPEELAERLNAKTAKA